MMMMMMMMITMTTTMMMMMIIMKPFRIIIIIIETHNYCVSICSTYNVRSKTSCEQSFLLTFSIGRTERDLIAIGKFIVILTNIVNEGFAFQFSFNY